uniref:Structural maintenance of chromosomes protein 6 n=1 Tax=Aceria tosichella TaxID=561515 RepID=A0A6G1SBV1_9ACAR
MAVTEHQLVAAKDNNSPPPFKPGSIRKIKLQNFMCHESFELNLGSRVNFIIGPNGSGKSALLTAVVVVLGGRATTTSRARKASDFVQYGKKFARITVEIHNYDKIMEKDKAFKPDEYGKRIIIEKIIYKDDQSGKLIIKNDQEKRVSERKQELDEMLDHFSIYINNPICVLNQEVSKSFLHSKKPEDKFDLFMKATNLEQIQNDYQEATNIHKEWGDCNNRKSFAFKLLDNEKVKCKEKMTFLEKRVKLQEKLVILNTELTWATRRDNEAKAEKLEEELKKRDEQAEKSDVEIANSRDKITSAESRIDQHTIRLAEARKEYEESKQKVKTLRDKELAIKRERLNVVPALEQEQRKLTRLEKDKADLIRSIDDIKEQQNNKDSAKENEKRKLEMAQIERETTLLSGKEKTLRQRAEQIHKSMTDLKQQISAAVNRMSSLKSELSQHEANLRNLSVGKDMELRKYGHHMQKICEAVNEAYKQGRFEKKPYGPLGFYIKVKTQKVAAALECALGRNVNSFTCDNHRDMLTLQNIFRTIRTKSGDLQFREPPIFVRRYCKKHNVSKFKPVHDVYQTLLDHIDINEDAVFNALVDRTSIETVMFIPNYNEARHIMVTPSLVPRGTRSAYTEDCHLMYPRTANSGFRTVAQNIANQKYLFSSGNDEHIRKKKQDIERVRAELRAAEEHEVNLRRSDQTQRIEYDENIAECERILKELRPLELRLLELKTTLAEDQPQELTGFEAELESCIARIHETKTKITELEHKLTTIDTELEEKRVEIESATKVLKLKEKELEKINTDISSEKDLIREHKEKITDLENKMKEADGERDKLTKELDSIKSQMEAFLQQVRDFSRPSVVRPTDEIQAETKKVKAALSVEIDENQDPEELMRHLRKRLVEINQVTGLKDHNLENFSMTTKSLKDRDEGFKLLRKNICGSVSLQFASVMQCMGMQGELTIHLNDHYINGNLVSKAKTLEMSIDTGKTGQHATQRPMIDNNNSDERDRRGTRSQPSVSDGSGGPRSKRPRLTLSPSEKENLKMTDTRSLSGGERSFSTVAFVLSLWHHCRSPFKLMDEIDVFMDMVTRRLSYNALIKFAQKPENEGQFIYFSPLELPEIDNPENMVRVFEMPRIIRRGAQSQPNGDALQLCDD